MTPYIPSTNQLHGSSCKCQSGEKESNAKKKGNGTRRCLETFADRNYLERLPRDHIYPLVRQLLYCTQPEVKLGVHKQGFNAANKSFHLESPLLLLVPREPKKFLHLLFPSMSLCKIQEHFPIQIVMVFHSFPLISHCPNPNFEKWSSCLVFLRYKTPKFISLLSSWQNLRSAWTDKRILSSLVDKYTPREKSLWWVSFSCWKTEFDGQKISALKQRLFSACPRCCLGAQLDPATPSVGHSWASKPQRTAGSSKQCTSLCQTHKMSLLNSTDEPNTNRRWLTAN